MSTQEDIKDAIQYECGCCSTIPSRKTCSTHFKPIKQYLTIIEMFKIVFNENNNNPVFFNNLNDSQQT